MIVEKANSKEPRTVSEESSDTPSPSKASGIKASVIHLGHIFSLRPRAETSFEPRHLQSAKVLLQDEKYPDLDTAARAVAEKALELTHKGGSKKGRRDQGRS